MDAEAAFTGRLFPTDFIWNDTGERPITGAKGIYEGWPPTQPNELGLTCPPVAAGAVSSSLSDSSLGRVLLASGCA